MTNEEAVKMLRTMQRTVYLGNRKFEDAIECAIKALSEPLQPWEVLVAQAVLPQPEIVRCKDCGHRDDHGCCKYWKGLAMGETPIATDDYDFCNHARRRANELHRT